MKQLGQVEGLGLALPIGTTEIPKHSKGRVAFVCKVCESFAFWEIPLMARRVHLFHDIISTNPEP